MILRFLKRIFGVCEHEWEIEAKQFSHGWMWRTYCKKCDRLKCKKCDRLKTGAAGQGKGPNERNISLQKS